MKTIVASLFFIAFITLSSSQESNELLILNKFITANNFGTEEAISQFIKETYEPNLYKKIDLKQHIDFYKMIAEDFGQLKSIVYKKTEENPLRLVVQLIKEKESLLNEFIDPTEILVVEIDMEQNNPKYLNRSLGLGALICESKKE